MKLSGAQAIIKVLEEEGVNTVFGYPGGQVIPLYDALYDAKLHNVLTVHALLLFLLANLFLK